MKAVAAVVFLGAFAVFSVRVKHQVMKVDDDSDIDSLPVGKAVPDFTLADTSGVRYTLSAVAPKEKLTLVNFWGTWCQPCRLEMPGFEKMYADEHKDGLQILAIDEEDRRDALDAYLKEKPKTFPILLDPDGAVAKRFGVRAFPTTILVGPDGKIIRVIEGVEPNLKTQVDANLKSTDKQ